MSFRLGGGDGVSVEAAKWAWALRRLGFDIVTVAGAGTADHVLPALAMGTSGPPARERAVEAALEGADVVVVENLCSLPLNPAAAEAVAACLRGRPAILRHHDLPWQRPAFTSYPPPPDDRAWRHVTINELSRRELGRHGIEARTVYNAFDPDPAPAPGSRAAVRAALGVGPRQRLVLQPTRALARKRVDLGIALAEQLGATYWLLGPAEDGYDGELKRLLARARCKVVHGWPQLRGARLTVADAYSACDVVALPSDWEGFGNPAVESATHRRALAIGDYPVGRELASFGFRWFPVTDAAAVAAWLERPDRGLLEHNAGVARRSFSLRDLPTRLGAVVADCVGSYLADDRR